MITTKWDRGYTKRVIPQVESFYVDSSLDNDADSWQLQIGDPAGDYLAMMNRDSEIRVELISADPGAAGHIMTGIADDITYDQDGAYTISGRDYACLALDSYCEPQKWKKVKPMYIIANQARKLGFPQIATNKVSKVKKTVKTDGSETFWEFWYRLVRNDKSYIWCGPNGALILNTLNYEQEVSYYFGTPLKTDSEYVKRAYISVEGLEIRKSTQGRVYQVWVAVNNGKLKQTIPVHDGSIGDWIKRPVKIIQDTKSHTVQGAKKSGWLEIYEGKVGAVEIRLVISDPTFVISPNHMCMVRIPEIDLAGVYFIVGTKVNAGPNGYIQEIRLREKDMALTRRIPAEPRIPHPTKKPPELTTSNNQLSQEELDSYIAQLVPAKPEWSDFFWNAAKKYQGSWDFDIFLSWLLAISKKETNFHNYRQIIHKGVDAFEWYADYPENSVSKFAGTWGNPAGLVTGRKSTLTRKQYELSFCNKAGTHGLTEDVGVGPMQLTTRKLKENADNLYSGSTASGGSSPVSAATINAYLTSKGSPMAGHGQDFVDGGTRNGYDPRLLVSISGGESSFGKNCFRPYNAWGWMGAPDFTNWTQAISDTSDYLGDNYINDKSNPKFPNGLHTIAAIGQKWAPVGASNDPQGLNKNWVPTNTSFMREQGGNPDDVTLAAGKGVQANVQSFGHDEYLGGRWNPEFNIMEGARYFAECLDDTHMGQDDEATQMAAMTLAASMYHWGAGSSKASQSDPYAIAVKKIAQKFLGSTRAVVEQVRNAETADTDSSTDNGTQSDLFPLGFPNEEQCIAAFAHSQWVGPESSTTAGTPAPSIVGKLPTIHFIQGQGYSAGRDAPILWIVIHTMESPPPEKPDAEVDGIAGNVAAGMASGANKYATHYCLDNKEIWQCVHDKDTGWGTAGSVSFGEQHSTNSYSLHFEHAGAARQLGQSRADMGHKALTADAVADARCDRRELGILL